MASKLAFTEEELKVDESLGYPKAYAKLCRSPNVLKPYSQGPPSIFVPYSLQPKEALRAKDLNQTFPVIDPEASPSMNPRGYVNLLWKQLDHLGNAGFDPALFRVDPYGNVLYLHADSASPLAWDIDHWFPCSRGGKTIPSNLRLLQWQVRKKKKNKLEFLVPWWDLQLGISVNQFLSSFASSNSDFRNRAFCFLFLDGGNEELNALQTADSHSFPQHYDEMKRHLGLAPAGIVSSQRSSDASVLRPLDINKNLRPNSPLSASRKFSAEEYDAPSTAIQRFRPSISKENDNPNVDCYHTNPYFSILAARESLRQREVSTKKQEEINLLEGELDELMQNNEDERIALQELEALVIKKRRRVEKCRRLAEAQASYRTLLEKMIRDAMHQAVVYKEQIRVNQAATSALMARLEAQREICDSSGRVLQKKFKQRDEIEKQIRPCGEHARKRTRIDDTLEERHDKLLWLSRTCSPIKKELRIFLEEEYKASEVGSSLVQEDEQGTKVEESLNTTDGERVEISKPVIVSRDESSNVVCTSATSASGMSQYRNANKLKKNSFIQNPLVESEEARTMLASKEVESYGQKLKKLAMAEELCSETSEPGKKLLHRRPYPSGQGAMLVASDETSLSNKLEKLEIRENQFTKIDRPQKKNLLPPNPHNEGEDDDNEEHRNQVGKENIEKWMKMMLDNAREGSSEDSSSGEPAKVENNADEIVSRLNPINAQKEIKYFRFKSREQNVGFHQTNDDEEINARGCDEKRGKKTIEISAITMLNKNIQKSGVGSSSASKGFGSRMSFEGKEREGRRGGTARCETARGFMSFPSSPTVILSTSKGVDCMGRKPKVIGDEIDDKEECNGDSVATSSNKFLKAWTTRSSK